MIHGFQSSITATKDEALRPPKGFRFGNFEGIRTLPSVGAGHVAGQHVKSYFNNKQIFYTICDWFETWMPWQKRIVLCGTTDRCSSQQLECLATALEPVFHRDFATALRGHYPRASLKKPKSQETSHMELVRALQMATEGTDLDPKSRLRAKKGQGSKDIEGFALNFVKGVLEVAVKKYLAEREPQLSSSDETEDENNNMRLPLERQAKVKFSEAGYLSYTSDVPYGNTSEPQNVTRQSDEGQEDVNTEAKVNDHSDVSPISRLSTLIEADSALSFDDVLSKKTSSKLQNDSKLTDRNTSLTSNSRPGSGAESSAIHQRPTCKTLAEHQVVGFDITPTQSKLPPLEAKKASTLSWCIKRQLSASLPSTPSSGNSIKHRHHSNVSSADVASASEFFQKQRVSRLGKFRYFKHFHL